jgi:pimeloyl-ACP methyl ester carboxylesterase
MVFTRRGMVRTPVLEIAYEEAGPPDGPVAVLSHGFPYDVRAYDEVAGLLAASGVRVIAPYLRGFGPTRFTDATTLRSGEQAALAQDLLDLIDALDLERPVVGGFDWGGRASCIVAALHPERVAGLVTVGGYNVFNAAFALEPAPPEWERTYWYQYYFHSERGRRGLERHRDELCELLWTTWSPEWADAATAFRATAPSLANPDFVDVVIHSYRHRFGLVDGDPRYATIEAAAAAEPRISVPTVALESGADGVSGPTGEDDRDYFTGAFTYRELPGIGHDLPQEAPREFAEAVLSLR